MKDTINAHKFAKTVVSAHSFDGSIEEIATKSLELYKAAFDVVVKHNEPIIEKQIQESEDQQKAFREAFLK
ncbi:hypothetical protein [Facklamia sp. P12950]|uniref:hypothetical protein n=1 Tax=Facklamia sp. P12950 TaxID=3421951 RepID=UPI003D1769EB